MKNRTISSLRAKGLRLLLRCGHFLFVLSFLFLLAPLTLRAAEIEASDGTANDYFGYSVSQSGTIALAGAYGDDSNRGMAYVFRNVTSGSGTVTQDLQLAASDGAANELFASSVSLSGATALAGALSDDSSRGSAYVFRNVTSGSGTVTQDLKLVASDGSTNDYFGGSVSLSGSIALAGAHGDDSSRGSAYVFRNVTGGSGTVTQDLKLTASDGATNDYFGRSVSQSGAIALAGAYGDDSFRGSAYVFRNVTSGSGTVTQDLKLIASDGAANDLFGLSVSQSGAIALAGAYGDDSSRGSAYVFRNVTSGSGTVTQDLKLIASDGAANDLFGLSVSQSGAIALAGAYGDDSFRGSAYVFRNVTSGSGTVTQDLKLIASDGAANDYFGYSVSIEGDNFVIGAYGVDSGRGKAYTGSVSSMSLLDEGGATRAIDGISFITQDDWIVGQTTDSNEVILTQDDTGNVTASGKAVFIGQNAGSDHNTLILAGTLNANEIYIGSLSGNEGNILQIENTAAFAATAFRLAPGNLLAVEGDYTEISDLLTYLGASDLQVWDGSLWETVDSNNYTDLIVSNFGGGYTSIEVVPEPGTGALLFLAGGALLLRQPRRRRRNCPLSP